MDSEAGGSLTSIVTMFNRLFDAGPFLPQGDCYVKDDDCRA